MTDISYDNGLVRDDGMSLDYAPYDRVNEVKHAIDDVNSVTSFTDEIDDLRERAAFFDLTEEVTKLDDLKEAYGDIDPVGEVAAERFGAESKTRVRLSATAMKYIRENGRARNVLTVNLATGVTSGIEPISDESETADGIRKVLDRVRSVVEELEADWYAEDEDDWFDDEDDW